MSAILIHAALMVSVLTRSMDIDADASGVCIYINSMSLFLTVVLRAYLHWTRVTFKGILSYVRILFEASLVKTSCLQGGKLSRLVE